MGDLLRIFEIINHYDVVRPQCDQCDSDTTAISAIAIPAHEEANSSSVGWKGYSKPLFLSPHGHDVRNLIFALRCENKHEWKLQWNTLERRWEDVKEEKDAEEKGATEERVAKVVEIVE